ncbi:MAG: endonuclease III [Ruminococcus sp.]|nr:endonuclease III [Ruminococcus sp.]
MTKEEIAKLSCMELEKLYPDIQCTLKFEKPYELLIATRLAAQCTDARVNRVTKDLFRKYPALQAFADADLSELEQDVKSCGLYRTKAKSIKEMSQQIIDNFGGVVPDNMNDLLSLSGVGRKIANLIISDVYGKPAIVTDTHCIRISGRLGLTENKDPLKVEKDLLKLIPPEISSRFCHQTVQFGRDVCRARNPKCGECKLNYFCAEYNSKL